MPRLLALLHRFALCSLLLGPLALPLPASSGEPADPTAESVRLVIDYGDGVQRHFTQLPWRKEMTVLEALVLASKHPRGIQLKYRGKAATVMVTQIDELTNQGGKGQNWIYRVNEKPGDRSCGIHPLQAGDTVLWKFETYR